MPSPTTMRTASIDCKRMMSAARCCEFGSQSMDWRRLQHDYRFNVCVSMLYKYYISPSKIDAQEFQGDILPVLRCAATGGGHLLGFLEPKLVRVPRGSKWGCFWRPIQ